MAILVRGGGGNSSKVLPLQLIAALSYMAILFRGGGKFPKSPPIAAHCSPLLDGNFSQGGGLFIPFQPIPAQSYMGI